MKTAANQIDDLKALLEKQIQTFQKKSELIAHRDTFIEKRDQLIGYVKEQGADFNENMDTHQLKLVLADNNRYADAKISISNNLVIREIIGSLIVKINIKIAELEKEIVA